MVLTAMGSVINKCITVAEILKRRVAGLHQWNQIKSIMLEVLLPCSHALDVRAARTALLAPFLCPGAAGPGGPPPGRERRPALTRDLHMWQKQVGSRPVSHMTITLSLAPDALEQSDVFGYQPPLPLDLVNPAPHHGVRKGPRDAHSPPNGLGISGALPAGLQHAGRQSSRGGQGGGRGRGGGGGKASASTE